MSMDDILKSLLGGAEAAPQESSASDGAISLPDLLQGILGGMGAQPQQQAQAQQAQGGADIGDILGGILGGGTGSAQGSSGGLGDILGGILGGGAGAQPQSQSQGGLDIGDILGGILGGGAGSTQGSTGGLGDILGGILGGGASSTQGSSSAGTSGLSTILAPIIQSLAQKMGLPPAIAQTVVGFALGKLLPSLLGGAKSQAQQTVPSQRRAQTPSQQAGGFNLDDLMDRLGSGNAQSVNTSYLQSTGIAAQLAQQTGLDENVAAESLQHVFQTFGSQMSAAHPAQAPVSRPSARARTTPKRRPPAKKRQTWEA